MQLKLKYKVSVNKRFHKVVVRNYIYLSIILTLLIITEKIQA